MEFIKEESEDVRIEETFRVKHEDTEEQTDLMLLKKENEVLNEMEEKTQYERHLDFITGDKSFICSQTQKSQKEVSSQKRAPNTGTRSYFTCQQCGSSFTQKGSLKVHMRIHTGESSFTCQQCGKCFIQKGGLKSHMCVHTGEKPYNCKLCGKSFTHKRSLNSHIKIHTGEKPYTCNLCGKSFSQKGNLTIHMRIHTGEKPFVCVQCGKSYRSKVNLNCHMKIHSQKLF